MTLIQTDMAENSSHNLPPYKSLDELVEFFETHDMGDYLEQMPDAHFDVAINRQPPLVEIDGEFADT